MTNDGQREGGRERVGYLVRGLAGCEIGTRVQSVVEDPGYITPVHIQLA